MKSKNLALALLLSAMCVMTACGSSTSEGDATNGNGVNPGPASTAGTNQGNTANNEVGTETADGSNTTNDGATILGTDYEDGTYRGSYVDGDVNQVSIEFVLKDQKFESIKYRALTYKGQNYLDEGATGVVKAVRDQFQQAADALIGKSISDIHILYKPGDVVDDIDTVTGATLRSGKLISALWDGLNRHPYKLSE